MATLSSILAWRIPWTEEPGGLHSPWGHNQSNKTEQLTHTHTHTHTHEGITVILSQSEKTVTEIHTHTRRYNHNPVMSQ